MNSLFLNILDVGKPSFYKHYRGSVIINFLDADDADDTDFS